MSDRGMWIVLPSNRVRARIDKQFLVCTGFEEREWVESPCRGWSEWRKLDRQLTAEELAELGRIKATLLR